MRVALLTYSTRPRGGVVHTLALAEALAAAGATVTVWSISRHGDTAFFRPVSAAVAVRIVPIDEREGEPFGARILRSIEVLRSAFAPYRDAYDVVHAQDCITANAAGPGCLRTVHHLDSFTTPELAACHERALREPSRHVCVSAAVAAELYAGWGLRATVIPNGVDAARFALAAAPGTAAERVAWRARLGRYVLAVGGIEPRKGTHDLVAAMAAVQAAAPSLRLVIAGGETLFDYRSYRDSVLSSAAALGVSPVLLGPVAHDRLPALVAAADVFAFPSTAEGFGLAAMEALAAGVPVVTRDLPVLREVFGATVLRASTVRALADALLAARASPPDPAPGRALAAAHTWSAAAAAHLRLYDSLSGA